MLAINYTTGVPRRPDMSALFVVLLLGLCLALSGCTGLTLGANDQPLANDCVWTLVVKDPRLAASVGPQISDGRSFVIEGRRLAREHPAAARQDLGCPPLVDLPHGLVEAAERLQLGQVAGPLELREGSAWVMRGSDSHRLLGQALLERKRYPAAIEEAQQDLTLNPASIGSWLVLGQSRLALDDPAGALQAFEQGLLVDPGEPKLRAGRDQAHLELARAKAAAKATIPAQDQTPVAAPPAPAPSAKPTSALTPPLAPATQPTPAPVPTAAPAPKLPAPTQTPTPSTEVQALLVQARQAEQRGDFRAATLAYHRAARLDSVNDAAKEGLRRNFLALDLGAGPGVPAPAAAQVKPASPALAAPPPVEPPPAPVAGKAKASPPPAPAPPTKAAPPSPPVKIAPREVNHAKLAKGVYIQVASRRDQGDAEKEAGAWRKRKLPVRLSTWKAQDGVVWWRVLLGPYPDRKHAQAAAQRLRRQGVLDFFLLVEAPRT